MTPTRRARELAQARANADIARQKTEYRDKLVRLAHAFVPPLSNAELSLALGLRAPDEGVPGASDVGRFVSDAPRSRRSRPDADARALIDALIDGQLLIAAQSGPPGARRPTLVCAPDDLPRLERGWTVVSLTRGRVDTQAPAGWEDADAWSTFGGGSDARPETRGHAWIGPWRVPALGLGAMRLSTTDMEDHDAVELLLHAFESGTRFVDTANVYSRGEDDVGRNERVIARALTEWRGDPVVVATKAGLARPGGRWVPDGRPEALTAAVEASLRALATDCLDLVQLHAVDRRVPIEDSVGALAGLREQGKVRCIGVCNVDAAQLDRVLAVTDIVSVQNPASFVAPGTATDVAFRTLCAEHGVTFIAHSPLGGHRRATPLDRTAALRVVAERDGISAQRAALAWLLSLGPGVIAIPGATRRESFDDSFGAVSHALTASSLRELDGPHESAAEVRRAAAALRPLVDEGVALVMGIQASGKSTHVERFVARGFARFNRDERGGRLADLLPAMDAEIAANGRRIVADNTYPTRGSRAEVIRLAERHGLQVAAVWMDTPLADALRNACGRMLDRHGRLLEPDELREAAKTDPNMLPPAALHRFEQVFEAPATDEGLSAVVRVPFARRPRGTRGAIIFDVDGTLRTTRSGAPFPVSAEDIELLPGRADRLRALHTEGVLILGVSNQAGVALGALDAPTASALFDHTCELLGVTFDIRFCPHPPRGAACWCRKPMPGFGVLLTREYDLDPALCTYVGDMATDEEFARNSGFAWAHADAFFDGQYISALDRLRSGSAVS